MPVPRLTAYTVLASSAVTGLSVRSVFLSDNPTVAATTLPSGAVNVAFPAFWPLTDAGSSDRENRTTTGLESGTFVAPSTGTTDVTVGTRVAICTFNGTTLPALGTVPVAVPKSERCRSSAVSVKSPTGTASAYAPAAPESATVGKLLTVTSAPANPPPPAADTVPLTNPNGADARMNR